MHKSPEENSGHTKEKGKVIIFPGIRREYEEGGGDDEVLNPDGSANFENMIGNIAGNKLLRVGDVLGQDNYSVIFDESEKRIIAGEIICELGENCELSQIKKIMVINVFFVNLEKVRLDDFENKYLDIFKKSLEDWIGDFDEKDEDDLKVLDLLNEIIEGFEFIKSSNPDEILKIMIGQFYSKLPEAWLVGNIKKEDMASYKKSIEGEEVFDIKATYSIKDGVCYIKSKK